MNKSLKITSIQERNHIVHLLLEYKYIDMAYCLCTASIPIEAEIPNDVLIAFRFNNLNCVLNDTKIPGYIGDVLINKKLAD